MNDEPPVSYENYPTDSTDKDEHSGGTVWQSTPPARPALTPLTPMPPPPAFGTRTSSVSRRGLLGAVVALPALGLGAWIARRTGGPGATSDEWNAGDASGTETEDADATTVDFTSISVDIPDGWQVAANGDRSATITHGSANQVRMLGFDTDATSAVTLMPVALKKLKSPFHGTTGKPHDASTGGEEVATLRSTGTFDGKPARQLVRLVLDTSSQVAVVTCQILTAKEGSQIAKEASGFVEDLNSSWDGT